MGLFITLEDEKGTKIFEFCDSTNLIETNWEYIKKKCSKCVCFIDLYGDTVFNKLQMDTFLKEWKLLSLQAKTVEEKKTIFEVNTMAEKCKKEVHLYLKFRGD